MPFITFEGPDGAGKTTHIRLLADYLQSNGTAPLVTREPGGTQLGNSIRTLVLGSECDNISPLAEMLLIAAARAQHADELLRPQLAQGRLVICDRYIDSSLAYQGYALGLGIEQVLQVNQVATQGLWPDLTILLMLSPEAAFARSRRGSVDRIESRGLDYYRRVCQGYREVARIFPDRIAVVDVDRPLAQVQQEIRSIVNAVL